jgi:hypothetical protein
VIEPAKDTRAAGQLEVVADASTGREFYALNGVELRDGDRIELAVADGTWIAGGFCWSGKKARWPGLRIDLAIPASIAGVRPKAVISIPPAHAVVRFALSRG